MEENERQHWALLRRYQAHLSQARASGDVWGEHIAQLGLGVNYFHLGQWQNTREHLTPALSWLGEHGYWLQEMEHRALLAYACLFDYQAGLALEHFTALQQLAHTHGVSSREAEGLLGCSRSLSAMDREGEAVQALPLTQKPANADIRLQVLYELGFRLGHMGRNQEAIAPLEEALPLAREQGETGDEAHIHADLGVFLLGIPGRAEPGIDHLLAALALFRQIGNQREQAKTLADLATAYLRHRSARSAGLEEGLRYKSYVPHYGKAHRNEMNRDAKPVINESASKIYNSLYWSSG